MATKTKMEAQNPLILRCQRLVEAFAKSDDERDFFLDRQEGFILYADLDKPAPELKSLEDELASSHDRYVPIPKLTFYETKKIMEGFVNEKVYDIDTKEKLLEIIQSKEARDNFLDFIYDHHSELEKWQQFYQERFRIRIIEWLRNNHFHFVFEEDLDLAKSLIEKLKRDLFQTKVGKDIQVARKTLVVKAKTYYSNEALNPRPKRGRPPKQAAKLEIEPQISTDIYTTVPAQLRLFLFIPDYNSSSSLTFSSRFDTEEELLASRKASLTTNADLSLESLNLKLAALRTLSSKWLDGNEGEKKPVKPSVRTAAAKDDEDEEEEDDLEFSKEVDHDEDDLEIEVDVEEETDKYFSKPAPKINGRKPEKAPPVKSIAPVLQKSKKGIAPVVTPPKTTVPLKAAAPVKAVPAKTPVPMPSKFKSIPLKKAPVAAPAAKKFSQAVPPAKAMPKAVLPVKKAPAAPIKKAAPAPTKKPPLRSIMKVKPKGVAPIKKTPPPKPKNSAKLKPKAPIKKKK